MFLASSAPQHTLPPDEPYTLDEVSSGPIITRLAESRQLTSRPVAQVPLDEKNTPVVFLGSTENEELRQQARVEPDGSFAFRGLADGKYTLRLYPVSYARRRAGSMRGVSAFSFFGFNSANEPWEKSITIQGKDLELPPINLHEAGVLPGRVTGVAYNPDAPNKPFANAFGYICAGENEYDTVGGSYDLLRFMTDADGRFRVDACPPGKQVLRWSEWRSGYSSSDPSVWIRVTPEKTIDLRLFAPETDNRLAIDFVVGDGSSREVHAGFGLDADVIAKHVDPKTGELLRIIAMPAAALSGTFEYPGRGSRNCVTIEAAPRKPGLPTRTCHGETTFRFVGLAPGEYSLRFEAGGCETKRIDNVIVRKGRTTWLDKVALKRAAPKTKTKPGSTKPGR